MSDRLNYDTLVEDFSRKLVTQLRSHGADQSYLEMWVPDEDPVKSILNMVEAAGAYGRDSMEIEISKKTLSNKQVEALVEKISTLGHIRVQAEAGRLIVSVSGISA